MISVNEWFVFDKAIDNKTCNKIKRLGAKQWQSAAVDTKKGTTDEERKKGRKPEMGVDEKTRVTDVAWTNDQWVYDVIWPFMMQANAEAGWQYEIKSAESSQITRYKKGGFYNFHRDGAGCHLVKYNNPTNAFMHDNVRKLSMTIPLNVDEYKGGDLELKLPENGKRIMKLEQGNVIVFPSFIEHRVLPVTQNTRYSLVAWVSGPPWR